MTSTAISIRRQASDRLGNLVGVGQDELLERRTIRRMRIHRREPPHWSVERIESILGDYRGDFAADSSGEPILMDNQHLTRLARRREDRFAVERQERPQVEHLN